jgi:hypothetical protein
MNAAFTPSNENGPFSEQNFCLEAAEIDTRECFA